MLPPGGAEETPSLRHSASRLLLIQSTLGQYCDICSQGESDRARPITNAIDGTERWWQSPPLSRSTEFNEVNVTLNLGQDEIRRDASQGEDTSSSVCCFVSSSVLSSSSSSSSSVVCSYKSKTSLLWSPLSPLHPLHPLFHLLF
ncbi:unnamed protein product [Pleuronectes platessa]|uniref:Laminin N-terminal domain-containing protein n=1 Tax=Pleuronectes platessa TaxID=8262 RepID=A0A9N7UTI5_PLEPL|nr:unnamed protein product [Pleuronectes platessa]